MSPGSYPDSVECLVEVNGHQIAIIDGTEGRSGPAVVFLHGILMSVTLWPELLKKSELDDFRWISISLPGHFPSKTPKGFTRSDVTDQLFSDCVIQSIKTIFREEPVHLVGWSTGGYAALVTAANHPASVKSIVCLSGFARGQWRHLLGWMQKVARSWWSGWTLVGGIRYVGISPRLFRGFHWLMSSRRAEHISGQQSAMKAVFEDYRRHDAKALRELIAGLAEVDVSSRLREIKAPVLILGGAIDKVIPPAEAHHLHQHLVHSELVEQPEVGHMFFTEALDESLRYIENWIHKQEQSD